MRAARARTGFSKHVVLAPRKRTVLSTSRAVESDIFSSLSFLSEVPEVGKNFIAARNPSDADPARTFLLLRAFIRQARTFWEAAKPLHHRAGPLNYYYCFLNLAKAYIALDDPKAVAKRINHGLSAGEPPDSFRDATAKVQQQGVFPLFYRTCFGLNWPDGFAIPIMSAFGYAGDITHEYLTGGFGPPRRMMGMCRIETHEDQAFATIALMRYDILSGYPKTRAKIETVFDVVDLGAHVAEREFGLLNEERRHFTFLETKKTFPIVEDRIPADKIVAECYSALKDEYLFVPYELDRLQFTLYTPLSEVPNAPFNEVMGIYVAMYYLSSLVRYHPFYLEQMLESKEAWLIETFALSAPHTLLRHMANLILNEERIYKSL